MQGPRPCLRRGKLLHFFGWVGGVAVEGGVLLGLDHRVASGERGKEGGLKGRGA